MTAVWPLTGADMAKGHTAAGLGGRLQHPTAEVSGGRVLEIMFGGVHSPPTHSTHLLPPRAQTLSPFSPPPKHPLDPSPLLEICPVDRGHLHHPRYLPHPPFIWLVQIIYFCWNELVLQPPSSSSSLAFIVHLWHIYGAFMVYSWLI